MIKVYFPTTQTPVLKRIRNIFTTHGDILSKKERIYAKEFTDTVRTCVSPWENEPPINYALLMDAQDAFEETVRKKEPHNYKSIIKNVEDYVYKDAQYHYDIMSNPDVQNKLENINETSEKVLTYAIKREDCWIEIEKILGQKLQRNEDWPTVNNLLKENKISSKKRELCRFLHKKLQKYDTMRAQKALLWEQQRATNEATAKQYGFWKSYDFVYNNPIK